MTTKLSRRSFLAGSLAAAGVATGASLLASRKAQAAPASAEGGVATLIDLTKCDGCPGKDTPACVAACRTENADRFPKPDPAMLKDYWPRKKHEDWSKKQGLTSRLTPYNWLTVQHLTVEHEGEQHQVHVPRRCMHCDNPPCVNACPFGALKKTEEGPTWIDGDLCMGGAKCRAVCPWDVPQRQAGVGIYTYLDPLPVGGGQMFKCDLCKARREAGGKPACVEQCPQGAMHVGTRAEIEAKADALAAEYGGHIYGRDENGGTSTLYVSRVPFEVIDQAIVAKASNAKPNKRGKKPKPMRMHDAENVVEAHNGLALGTLIAPLTGLVAAFAATANRTEKATRSETEEA